MKNTLISLLLFVFLTFLFSNKVLALLPPVDQIRDSIQIKLPTATPTLIQVQFKPVKEIDVQLKPVSTSTPTPKQVVVTQIVTATPQPTKEVKISPTIEPSKEPTKTMEVVKKATEEAENTRDLSNWFWEITIGLLILIIIIQVWPKKNKKVSDR